MSWGDILGQGKIKSYFKKVLLENKLANAYCFFGIEGVGKFATALEIIKTSCCKEPTYIDGFLESCGTCVSCLDIINLKHPNVEYIFSIPSSKTGDKEESTVYSLLSESVIEEINLKLKEKVEFPYSKFSIRGASQIRIAQIRELRKSLSLSNSLPGKKFVLIFNADEMRIEAQNAFLKTLEEPRNDITFFLLTSRRESLLQTILSRCQSVYFSPLTDDEIINALQQSYPKSETELRVIARFANGSLTKAYELLESNLIEIRNALVDLLRISLKKELPGKQFVDKINVLAEDLDKKNGQIYLQLLANWIRDAILISKNGKTEYIVNFDDVETLNRFAGKFGLKQLNNVIDLIEQSILKINSNVQIPSVFLSLFLEIRKILIEI